MTIIKLLCAGCSAPLQIGDDVENFVCGYCGIQQLVERSGGIISLKKFTAAIHAVQKGTDRTAAELAIPRLNSELLNARTEKLAAMKRERKKWEGARSGRLMMSILISFIIFFIGIAFVIKFESRVVAFISLFLSIIVPIFVFIKTKIPPNQTDEVAKEFDLKIARIEAQLKANRAILDAPL